LDLFSGFIGSDYPPKVFGIAFVVTGFLAMVGKTVFNIQIAIRLRQADITDDYLKRSAHSYGQEPA
jgi:hypothetical protein